MSGLPKPSAAPCGSCPYRLDVPSGVWDASEYAKLLNYDGETYEQVINGGTALFFCHRNDGHLCAGWLGCHDTRHLAALRMQPVDPVAFDYQSPIPLFRSGREAAEHGLARINNPDADALAVMDKLRAMGAGLSESR